MTDKFKTAKGGVPFPRTAQEWIDKGRSPEEAVHRVTQDVFGAHYKINAKGEPIESGRGSAANPVNESAMAIAREKNAAEDARRRLGWHKSLENAFDPRSAA